MEGLTVARIIHIVAVIIWIGGVSMVTTVIIPAVKKMKTKEEKIDAFERIEGMFSVQAKIMIALAGISGFYMLSELHAWDRYLSLHHWWLHAMTIVWIMFALVVFVFEPLFLRKIFRRFAEENPEKTFWIIEKAHQILLAISIITVIGSVAGSHGLFFF